MNTDSESTSSPNEITTDVPTQTATVETTTTGGDVPVFEISPASEVQTDNENTEENTEENAEQTEEQTEENAEQTEETDYVEEDADEDECERIFIVTVNNNVAGFTKDEKSAQNTVSVLATILSSRNISNYQTETVVDESGTHIYGQYKFFLFSYQRLLFDITYYEIPNLTFSN